MTSKMTDLEMFASLVQMHDLTYEYSDDSYNYSAGELSLQMIKTVAKDLPRKDVVRIWNANVDMKMSEGFRKKFYWTV